MAMNLPILFILITVSSITAQTFQYSRGWTNGKRDGVRKDDVSNVMERFLSPCQLKKLKYLLEGKNFNERFYVPCDYHDEDLEIQSKRFKADHSQEPLFEVFQ